MLDALLANEVLPEEYQNRWQVLPKLTFMCILLSFLHLHWYLWYHNDQKLLAVKRLKIVDGWRTHIA